jgi:hypothetical protein
MAALQGLTGLYADPQDTTDFMDEGVLEARANPLVSEHGEYGSQSDGYSGTIPAESPYAPMMVYDGWTAEDASQYESVRHGYDARGEMIDKTPGTHAAPWPRGIIQQSWDHENALAAVNDQRLQLHQPDLGGPRFYNGNSMTGHEEETHYTTNDYIAPNENYLATVTEGQLKGPASHGSSGYAGGNADPTQGYGVLNTLPEFNAGHSIRREQHDSVHFDYTNTHGEQSVPFMGRHPVQQMPLDGPDSPYFEQGDIDGANVVWEGRIGDPTAYQQPVEPTIAATPPQAMDVYAW